MHQLTHLKGNQTFALHSRSYVYHCLIKRRCLITPRNLPYTRLILKEKRSYETKICYKPLKTLTNNTDIVRLTDIIVKYQQMDICI